MKKEIFITIIILSILAGVSATTAFYQHRIEKSFVAKEQLQMICTNWAIQSLVKAYDNEQPVCAQIEDKKYCFEPKVK